MAVNFDNYAGLNCFDYVDGKLREELIAAAIPYTDRHEWFRPKTGADVKSIVVGSLYGWSFRREWNYWAATGPGLPMTYAGPLHISHRTEVRVNGSYHCPSPLEALGGFAVSNYHVCTQDGLIALADALTRCADEGITALQAERRSADDRRRIALEDMIVRAEGVLDIDDVTPMTVFLRKRLAELDKDNS